MAKEKINLSLENRYIFGPDSSIRTEFTEKEMFTLLENSAFYLLTKTNKSLRFITFKPNKDIILSQALEDFSLLREAYTAMRLICTGDRNLNLNHICSQVNRIETKIEKLIKFMK